MALELVSKTKHAGFGFKLDSTDFLKNWGTIPLVSSELSKVLHWGVVCFKKQAAGGYQLSLLSGVVPNRNLFVHPKNNKIGLPYLPAAVRAYPFKMVNNNQQTMLAVVGSEKGFCHYPEDAVLNESGELTEKGQNLISFLSVLEQKYKADQAWISSLAEFNLLKPFTISQKLESGEEQILREDVYIMDQDAFSKLDDSDLAGLVKSGAMRLAYLQMLSMDNWSAFNRYVEYYASLVNQPETDLPDVEAFFADSDEELKF